MSSELGHGWIWASTDLVSYGGPVRLDLGQGNAIRSDLGRDEQA
jgi:hypothetical protein